ncbi:hypothetical protein AA0117_g4990 [Alternaria alternata]|uniref:Uncharacterized protein n=1 Tax=Alternaria alternata TaxID=5599 RepID=A0A4Q4NL37_ALTAL|nr:hypothetical protein AA0117_g4990 [Alternaria alternata]
MEDTNMATSSLHQQHQQFGQGLGNNGDGPPGDRQDDKSQRGHYADVIRPPDFMAVMKDAGVKHFHTRCMMCGETATSHHRKTWRECRGRCPLNPNHTHTQQICPDLLKVANEDWCIAHLEESMKAERDTARGPETLQRQEQRRESQCEHRHEAPGVSSLDRQAPAAPPKFSNAAPPQGNWQTNRSPTPYLDDRRSSSGSPQITGTRNRNQAVQYSPSTHKTPAQPHNVPATDPTDLLTDVDIDSTELPGMALIDVDRYVDLARRIPTDGFLPLIKAGFDDERASGSPLSGIMEDPEFPPVWQGACDRFFCSMNEEVLIETIAGNIDLAYLKSRAAGTDVAQYIDKLRDRASYHPSCYVRPLTDTNGSAMSLDHYEQMLDIAERYCERSVAHATEAYNIDCIADEEESQTTDSQDTTGWSLDDSRKGIRRHLQTSANAFSESRAKCLRAWIVAGRARIRHCRSQGINLAPTIQYVGYAMNAAKRRKGHESRNSASWLSLLVSDICETQWPGLYRLKFYVICLILDPGLGQLCEVVFCRYLRAYTVNGGLSIDWAGKSISSLALPELTDAERDDFWARKQKWIEKNTDLTANVTLEGQRRKALYKAEYMQKIAAGKKRLAQLKQRTANAKSLFAQAEETLRIERKKGPLTAKNAQALEAVELGKAILKR